MDSKLYQTVDHPKWEPQVARGLFGIRLLILHYKFQFSKSIKSSMFRIFLNLTYSLRKNISFPKCPKITRKFTQNRQTVVMVISREILIALLKTWPRYWQKGRAKRCQNSLQVYPRLKQLWNESLKISGPSGIIPGLSQAWIFFPALIFTTA